MGGRLRIRHFSSMSFFSKTNSTHFVLNRNRAVEIQHEIKKEMGLQTIVYVKEDESIKT